MTKKLLLADDSITIQKVVEFMLADEDFEIRVAGNGEEALSVLSSFRPDIVLADVEMPGMNGYQLCREIKSKPDTMNTPVILLAGAFEPVDEGLAAGAGADGYIVKPFESAELLGKINALSAKKEITEGERAYESASDIEASGSDEDVSTMEGAISGPAFEEGVIAAPAEGVIADYPGFAEAIEAERETEKVMAEGFSFSGADEKGIALSFPSKEDLADIFRRTIDEKVAAPLLSEMRDALQPHLASLIKDSVENIVRAVVPGLAEKLLGEAIRDLAIPLSREAERAVWETVPSLAEAIIKKEIERIKAEF